MIAPRKLANRSPVSGSNPHAPVSLFDALGRTTTSAPVPQASNPRTDRSTLTREEILSQVDRILAGSAFDASERNRAFLRYVVEETLAGRTDYIKGYTVALNVFNRDPDFDPQLDPVVRIEASRLRRSLERYYFTAGKFDRIRVELPKGGYIPRFEVNEDAAPACDPAPASEPAQGPLPAASSRTYSNPAVVVLGFENINGDPSQNDIARGIAEELVWRLTRCDDLMVFAANASMELAPLGAPLAALRDLVAGYMLKGSIQTCGDHLRISVQLLDLSDGRFLWAEKFDHELKANDLWTLQENAAESIATCIAAPYGAIRRLWSSELLQQRPPGLAGSNIFFARTRR
jgi:adenylate cyclase